MKQSTKRRLVKGAVGAAAVGLGGAAAFKYRNALAGRGAKVAQKVMVKANARGKAGIAKKAQRAMNYLQARSVKGGVRRG